MNARRTDFHVVLAVFCERAAKHELRHRTAHDVSEAHKHERVCVGANFALIRSTNPEHVQGSQPQVSSAGLRSKPKISVAILQETLRHQRTKYALEQRLWSGIGICLRHSG